MAHVADQEYVEAYPLTDLRPHPDNAKEHDVEGIGKSMDNTGFIGAIVVQKSTGYILAGHGTVEAAEQEGLDAVPVLLVDLPDDKAKDYLIAANRLQELAGYDPREVRAAAG